jgi:hypothetical protein
LGIHFAHDFLNSKCPLHNLLFCDESRFSLGPDNHWVWRRCGGTQKEFSPKQISILKCQFISGGIVFGFKSRQIIFDENVNSAVHVESMINTEFVGLANAMFGECHWYLVYDGASCYTSAHSLGAFFEIWNVFPEWLSNSRDLNPILYL